MWWWKITVKSNGSLKIEGDFEIVDNNGNVYGLEGRDIISLCRCGQSKNMPFCDGSHKTTSFSPVKYQAAKSEKVYFCGCKETKNPPLCDGSHKQS